MKFIYFLIDPTSGSSVDWAYGAHNIPLVYTLEMRANGNRNTFSIYIIFLTRVFL